MRSLLELKNVGRVVTVRPEEAVTVRDTLLLLISGGPLQLNNARLFLPGQLSRPLAALSAPFEESWRAEERPAVVRLIHRDELLAHVAAHPAAVLKMLPADEPPVLTVWSATAHDRDVLSTLPARTTFVPEVLSRETAALHPVTPMTCLFVHDRVDAAVAGHLASHGCRLVLLRCSGTDGIDLPACQSSGLRVVRVPGYAPATIAEFTVLLLLAALRNLPSLLHANGLVVGQQLAGKRAAVLGMGRVGRLVAGILVAMGCPVRAFDKVPPDASWPASVRHCVSPEDCLSEAEVVCLHLPLTQETRHIVGAGRLGMLARGAVLVNTSRGELVDNDALLRALDSGLVTAAALDVLEHEQHEWALLCHPRVIRTSHVAYLTQTALHSIAATLSKQIAAFMHSPDAPLPHELP